MHCFIVQVTKRPISQCFESDERKERGRGKMAWGEAPRGRVAGKHVPLTRTVSMTTGAISFPVHLC